MAEEVNEITKCRFIINKFLVDVKKFESKDWGREVKMAKKLLTKKFDFDFWKRVPVAQKYFSLSFFLTKEGKIFLSTQKKLFKLELLPSKEYLLSEEKSGEDKYFNKKPNNLLEFIKYGET